MCLILVAWRAHPDFPLVVAANRDESFGRPSLAAHWWEDHPDILAGRDLEAGGSWLGITRQGAFAGLTNFRDTKAPDTEAPSRGTLVANMLQNTPRVDQGLAWLQEQGPRYKGFNLIFSDGQDLAVHESAVGRGRLLAPGIYGLSNHLLDTPWPKVVTAKSRLHAALEHLPDTTALLALLRDDQPAPDGELPLTGLSMAWERMLSSAFIRAPGYGTRCSTIITVDRMGQACFQEWTWTETGDLAGAFSQTFGTRPPPGQTP